MAIRVRLEGLSPEMEREFNEAFDAMGNGRALGDQRPEKMSLEAWRNACILEYIKGIVLGHHRRKLEESADKKRKDMEALFSAE